MGKESLEVVNSFEGTISLEYEQPSFAKRCLANFLDIIFFFLIGVSMFIFSSKVIVANTSVYKQADNYVAEIRKESHLYEYSSSRKTWENMSAWLDNNNDTSFDFRVTRCKKAIEEFQTYIKTVVSDAAYEDMTGNYNEARLSANMKDPNGLPLFVWNEGHTEIIHNPDENLRANGEYYYTKFYREYTLVNCDGYMVYYLPQYRDALKVMSNMLFFVEIPVSVVTSGVLTYLLPGIAIFRRGRMTFGKKLMGVGLVDSNVLSPTVWRFLARWAIFFVGEVLVGIFTFGITFIISFSMMAFTKRKQGFPDYMLGLTEVDTNKQKIYFNKYEISLENATDHKEAVKFKMTNDE